MSSFRLEEITNKIGSGSTPKGGKSSYKGGMYALIRSQNVLDMSFSKDGLAYINDEQAKKLDNVIVKSGDVLFNITGDSICRCCVVPDDILPARVNQHVAIIRPDNVNSYFLMYYLQYLKPYLLNICGNGSSRNALTKENLENLIIEIPEHENEIAGILRLFDEKISLNQRINSELESLAKTIYDYWFLQFEFPNEEGLPYKSSGGKMVWSEELKREIPEGWEVRQLSYLSEHITDGEHGSVSDNPDSGYYLLSCKNIVGGKLQIGNFERQISKDSFDKMRRRTRLEKGDILLSSVGTIGEVCMLDLVPDNIEFQRSVAIIKPDYSKVSSEWMYENILSMRKIIENTSHGAVQKCVFISDIVSLISILPPKSLMNKYTNMVEVYFRIISILRKENRELAALRDWLLPMLMNGQVTVE